MEKLNGKKMIAMVTLKKVCALAICLGTTAARASCNGIEGSATGEKDLAKSAKGLMKGKIKITPAVLKKTWTIATRTASLGFPIDATPAVMQVPMFAPRERAIPASRVMIPCIARTITTPVVAELD